MCTGVTNGRADPGTIVTSIHKQCSLCNDCFQAIGTYYNWQFSVLRIEYPLRDSSKKGSHVYFLLIVAIVLLLWQIVLLWHQVTIVTSEQHLYQTIVLPRKLATGSIHNYLFCYCPLVGILFEVLKIHVQDMYSKAQTPQQKY